MKSQQTNKVSLKVSIRFLCSYLKHFKWLIFVVLFFAIVSAAVAVGANVGIQYAMAGISNFDFKTVCIVCGSILGLYSINWFFLFIQYSLVVIMGQKIGKSIREDIFKKLNRLPIKYFDTNKTGDIMSKFTNDVNNITMLLSENLAEIISSGTWIFGLGIGMLFISPTLSIIAFALIALGLSFLFILINKSQPHFNKLQVNIGKMTGFLEENIEGQSIIDLYSKQDLVAKKFDEVSKETTNSSYLSQFYGGLTIPWSNFITNTITVIVSVIGIVFIVTDNWIGINTNIPITTQGLINTEWSTNFASLTVFLLLMRNFMSPFAQLSNIVTMILAAKAGINRIEPIFHEKEEFDLLEKFTINVVLAKNDKVNELLQLNQKLVIVNDELSKLDNNSENTNNKLILLNRKEILESEIKRLNDPDLIDINGNIEIKNLTFQYIPNSFVTKFNLYINPNEFSSFNISSKNDFVLINNECEVTFESVKPDWKLYVNDKEITTNKIVLNQKGLYNLRIESKKEVANYEFYISSNPVINKTFEKQYQFNVSNNSCLNEHNKAHFRIKDNIQYTFVYDNVEIIENGEFVFDKPGKYEITINKNNNVLKNVNISANAGDTIAIVGPTGSGKSTIINLLTKYYEIDQGDILFDGISIKDIKKDSLRANISMVLQDTYLFNMSINDNIRLGNQKATNDEIISAAKIANCHDFIMTLPKGYDTIIENNGEGLSKGQKQLLAIARAILSRSNILILDEATSSIDTKTEKDIQEAIDRLIAKKTSFLIAHRLSTVRNATKIVVLKAGKIIEIGNHDELIALNGFYASMFNSQFGNDLDLIEDL